MEHVLDRYFKLSNLKLCMLSHFQMGQNLDILQPVFFCFSVTETIFFSFFFSYDIVGNGPPLLKAKIKGLSFWEQR